VHGWPAQGFGAVVVVAGGAVVVTTVVVTTLVVLVVLELVVVGPVVVVWAPASPAAKSPRPTTRATAVRLPIVRLRSPL
jgi:hypothetical protein